LPGDVEEVEGIRNYQKSIRKILDETRGGDILVVGAHLSLSEHKDVEKAKIVTLSGCVVRDAAKASLTANRSPSQSRVFIDTQNSLWDMGEGKEELINQLKEMEAVLVAEDSIISRIAGDFRIAVNLKPDTLYKLTD
jgi:hypothetical protein